ncbi:MAG: Polysaccharide biosynthesis protein CapD, partial [Parcubacteria group bacterium GW2011_GWC1_41_7]
EKLFEEMLTAEEGTVATQNQKIFTAKLSEINTGRIENSLGELKKYVQNNQTAEAIKVLENIVPFYKGQARDY